MLTINKSVQKCLNIIINGQKLEQVVEFKYLGSRMMDDSRFMEEIRGRTAITKQLLIKRKNYQ